MAVYSANGSGALSIDDADYQRFRELISSQTGLDFPENRRADLAAGLRRALADSSYEDLVSYYVALTNGERGREEFERLLPHLTTGETYFFRNTAQFDALREEILPDVLARNRVSRRLRIWSAGCSSGEEPYSIAMLLREFVADIDAWDVVLLGTDINHDLLRRAGRAHYGSWSFRGCTPTLKARYFTSKGGEFHLTDEIKRMVTFARHNLASDPYPPLAGDRGALDLIICRNVTIYFGAAATQQVVNRFHDCLGEGGWLIVGHAEPSVEIYRRFGVRNFPDTVAYQRVPPEPPTPMLVRQPLWLDPVPSSQLPIAPAPLAASAALGAATSHERSETPTGTADDTYRYARELADRGRLEEAQRLLEGALAADPLEARAHYLLGLVHREQEEWSSALDSLRRAIFLDGTFILAHVSFVSVALRTGNVAQARRSLETARELLKAVPANEVLPDADGLTAGRLLHSVLLQLRAL